MTDNDLYDLMHSIIIAVTGLAGEKVIPADDNEQAPSGAYASIKVGASRGQRGQANISVTNTAPVSSPIGNVLDTEHEIKPQLTVDVSVNFYRASALQNATLLFQANKRPDISALLFAAGVGWRNSLPINDLTALQSKEREERSQITITLLYEGSQKVITNAIYTVPVSIENEDGDTIQTETISSPVEP
jgi:hypothetical protein